MRTEPTRRALFVAGKLEPRSKPKHVCSLGNHYGRPLRADVYAAAGGMWKDVADCSLCRSTVSLSQFVRAA